MEKPDENKEPKESPLVAVVIKEGNKTTLITPNARYLLGNGGLLSVERVKDYSSEVKMHMAEIAEHASTGAGVYSDQDILIQVRYGSKEIKLG
jgi:hypothetical protein